MNESCSVHQMYECPECHWQRAYGMGSPEQVKATPVLHCPHCCCLRRFMYVGVRALTRHEHIVNALQMEKRRALAEKHLERLRTEWIRRA